MDKSRWESVLFLRLGKKAHLESAPNYALFINC